ncbi:conjugal transfer protein TraF [Alkalimarinus alittae]|uniref:Conjugal transfer protein TraF n=1 Tax=Alkalimarinus alittae TaxID=2961619 RepID=A0ABY6N040_9ALTE|nr:conjugal transfer protein TraF [Alkalimarinus alittae]UZE95457.1 conjugal transfer protein TraF [Alkalimarinus alittae]
MKHKLLAISIGLVVAQSQTAFAAPNGFQDARSFAMGGTGVASSSPASASFHNPALLAIKHEEKHDGFGLILPSFNIKYADDEEVIDQIDDIQSEIDTFNSAVRNSNQAAIQASATKLSGQFSKLNKDTAKVDAGLGAALVIPNQTFAVSVFLDGSVKGTVRGDIAQSDLAYLDAVAAGTQPATELNESNTNINSEATAIVGGLSEFGVSFATAFDMNGNTFTVGVSPKYVSLITYEYAANITSFDDEDVDADNYETNDSTFNMDLGVAYQFGQDKQWIAGLSIRNIIPTDLKTKSGLSMNVDPQATVGIAYTRDVFTLTGDLDLTENKAFGFEDDNQFISIGGEFDLIDMAQFRLGVRHNFGSSNGSQGIEEDSQLTAGVGFSPFGVHIELSGLMSSTEYGAAAELGFTF